MLDKLVRTPLLRTLTAEQFAAIEPHVHVEIFAPYTEVLKQGAFNKQFYVLLSGEAEVVKERPEPVTLVKLQTGATFGEVSCLTGDAVSATVKTLTSAEVISLTRDGLFYLMDHNKASREYLIHLFAKRLREVDVRLEEIHIRTAVIASEMQRHDAAMYGALQGDSEAMHRLRRDIGSAADVPDPVVITGEAGTGKRHAAARIHYESDRADGPLLFVGGDGLLMDELRKHLVAARGGTLVIFHAHLLPDGHLQAALTFDGTRIILTAPEQLPAWSKLQEARVIHVPPLRDRKTDIPHLVRLFLHRCKAGAQAGEPSSAADRSSAAISEEAMRLLMLYPYLEANVEELYQMIQKAVVVAAGARITPEHLQWGHQRAQVRQGRPKIGLALGSGTVRGTAHLGVLKVLEDAGIPIDIVTGTSAGALVGALYASGMSVDDMRQQMPMMSWGHLARPIVSGRAFFHNEPLGKWVAKQIGGKDIASFSLPFAAVAADETTGEAVIFRSGDAALAVQASTAIPGIMQPIEYEGRKLIDGAVVHRVPVALARSMGADIVIGVDVEVPVHAVRPSRYLWNTLLRTYYIMSERIASEELQLADVVIRPKMSTNIYRFKYAPEFMNSGETAARRALPAIRALLNDERHEG